MPIEYYEISEMLFSHDTIPDEQTKVIRATMLYINIFKKCGSSK